MQLPDTQFNPGAQAAHEPQCDGSVCSLAQPPPQQFVPAAHVVLHKPQLLLSVDLSTQTPLQTLRGETQHIPPAHDTPMPHAWPQLPQLLGSLLKSVQTGPLVVVHMFGVPAPQLTVHAPPVHVAEPLPCGDGAGHFVPHPPQLFGSLAVATQVPDGHNFGVAAGHAGHIPPEQLVPGSQCWPHDPQLLLSVNVSVHPLLQPENPGRHPPHMFCALQAVPRGHLFPHVPQLLTSFSGTHPPVHAWYPGWQSHLPVAAVHAELGGMHAFVHEPQWSFVLVRQLVLGGQ